MLPEKYKSMTDKEIFAKIDEAKKTLADEVLILGHHYQRDEVIKFADKTGDSLKLALEAKNSRNRHIVFCGVKFMAETADILTENDQIVLLPDLNAGCPMADMAQASQVEIAWNNICKIIDEKTIIPVTYVNSSAETKAFCGSKNGTVCTSSNAGRIINSILLEDKKVFFMPDRNLGINTAKKLEVERSKILTWNREESCGGLSEKQVKQAKVIVWNGYCPVHMRFDKNFVFRLKQKEPDVKILVHPEVSEEVADLADFMGSTEYIIKKIDEAPKGSSWAVGTEIHLVSRLAKKYPDKKIKLLDENPCVCSTMYRISPQHLLWTLESLIKLDFVNRICVDVKISKHAKTAINKMFELTD